MRKEIIQGKPSISILCMHMVLIYGHGLCLENDTIIFYNNIVLVFGTNDKNDLITRTEEFCGRYPEDKMVYVDENDCDMRRI